MRGPINDRFIDYKKLAIRYRDWSVIWFLMCVTEAAVILWLVFRR
jgi:hypothetical protein